MSAINSPTGGGRLTDEQMFDWLRLIRCENIGPRTFRQLVNRFGGAAAALQALPDLVARTAQGRSVRIADPDEVRGEMERAKALGVRFVVMSDPDYPPLLREIDSAPPVIAIRGDAAVLRRPCVAIVGARNASAAGLVFTDKLARGLANADYAIVSGLARGIDFAAHRASLQTGTIAVLAGGHARPYPAEHAPLLEEIAANGAVVSEMPLEWEPRGRDFPRRNRIVSGLCAGTVVVEAARRSGSLITARFAAEQGREVFAVPGSPLDPRAEGANDLLRQGATLCTRAEDVIATLAAQSFGGRPRNDLLGEGEGATDDEPFWDEIDFFSLQESGSRGRPREMAGERGRSANVRPQAPGAPPASGNGPKDAAAAPDPYALVLSLLGPAPVTVDELIRSAGLPARAVHGVLLELDLAGRLERHGANLVSLV